MFADKASANKFMTWPLHLEVQDEKAAKPGDHSLRLHFSTCKYETTGYFGERTSPAVFVATKAEIVNQKSQSFFP